MITNIIGILCLRKNAHQMVLNVLREFLHCKLSKTQYIGEQKKTIRYKLLLSIESRECQIIANVMEDGHVLRNVWQFVNEFREENS